MFKFKILFAFLSLNFLTNAQEYNPLFKKYSDSLRYCKLEQNRSIYNDSFVQLLKTEINDENAFQVNLDSVKNTVSVLYSPDQKLKIISWVFVNDKEEYTNHCLVLYRKKLNSESQVIWLKNKAQQAKSYLYDDLLSDEWVGALYYQMYQIKKKKKDYYIVLGLDGMSSFMNKKVIDVIWFDKDGELHLGAPMFHESEVDFTPQYRVVYEFADASTMLLRFETEGKEKLITFSNLVPSNQGALGLRQYYIPDGRIDYYKLNKKKKWIKYIESNEFIFNKEVEEK